MKFWLDKNANPLQGMFARTDLKYEYIRCPLCGKNKANEKHFIPNSNYRIVQCQNCKFIYENPRPTAEGIYSLYHDTPYSPYFDLIIKHVPSNLRIMKLNLKDINFKNYEQNISSRNKKILDIGCATGSFLEYMHSKGWFCYGVEPGDPVFKIASKNKNLKIFHGELLDAHFPLNFFDVIHLNNVIEHTQNPLEVLEECHRILKQGGLLILGTPDYGSIPRLLWGKAWRDFTAIHLCLFSKKMLRRTLRHTGFKVEKEISWGGGFAAGQISIWLRKFVDKFTKKFNIGDHLLVTAIKS